MLLLYHMELTISKTQEELLLPILYHLMLLLACGVAWQSPSIPSQDQPCWIYQPRFNDLD